jgi:putative transposase
MLHNYWTYDLLTKKVANICEELGIAFQPIDESYTSQECPICHVPDGANKKDRIFACGFCGYVEHRDIVGSRNIMLRGMQSLQSLHQGEIALLRGGRNASA